MNKQKILNIILMVVVGVGIVYGSVYAATTISTNIVTEGTLSVTGTSTSVFSAGIQAATVNTASTTATNSFAGDVTVGPILSNASLGGTIPHWEKFTVPYTSLTAASTTQTITLTSLPAKSKLQGITIKHSTAFTGSSLSFMTVSIGGSNSTTDFSNPFNVYQAVSNSTFLDNGGNTSGATMASQSLTATFRSTGMTMGNGSATSLTGGSVDIYVLLSTLQ